MQTKHIDVDEHFIDKFDFDMLPHAFIKRSGEACAFVPPAGASLEERAWIAAEIVHRQLNFWRSVYSLWHEEVRAMTIFDLLEAVVSFEEHVRINEAVHLGEDIRLRQDVGLREAVRYMQQEGQPNLRSHLRHLLQMLDGQYDLSFKAKSLASALRNEELSFFESRVAATMADVFDQLGDEFEAARRAAS